jgi:caspase domain-containing protein
MSMIARGAVATVALLLLPALAGVQGQAPQGVRRHALLIGIGKKYSVRPLDGPPNDVRSLASVLRDRYGFDSVQTVEDEQATRNGILAALDALQARTAPGDFILVYYSGHGTSASDRKLRLSGLSNGTGALLPQDFNLSLSDAELAAKVIVGTRDLRPRFERLEATRDVVVIFDTCYSANTARSFGIDDGSTSRSVPWDRIATRGGGGINFGDDDRPAQFGAETVRNEYPYKRTIYFAASGAAEEAQDIAQHRVARYPTVDGLAHGAFTNALLKGLAGWANTNGDDMVTYRELFEFARSEVGQQFTQTPQVSAPIGNDILLDRPVFGVRGITRPTVTVASVGPLRVLVRPGTLPEIVNALTGIPGIALLSSGAHDVRVESRSDTATLNHASGDRLIDFQGQPPYLAQQVAARVRRQARLHPLLNMTFPAQTFNVSMTLPLPRGYALVNEQPPPVLTIETPEHAFFIVLNIDAEGTVVVLEPREHKDLRNMTERFSTGIIVDPTRPTGIEFIKAFAFSERPPGVERFINAEIDPQTPEFDTLLSMIRSAPGRKAQALLKIATSRD